MLCNLFERIDKGTEKVDQLLDNGEIESTPILDYKFSATLGFGIGFFEKLKITSDNCPKKLRRMPSHVGLLDPSPYTLAQTDLLIQLCSTSDFVNQWVFENALHSSSNSSLQKGAPDVVTAINEWGIVIDIHAGFQRIDGRNLMGFNDGISNPDRLVNDVIWITEQESSRFKDGTYMVFQKIEHDLDEWRKLSREEEERWVGRSKGTGLLLGTLPKEQDLQLSSDLHSSDTSIRKRAMAKWKSLLDEQKNPEYRFYDGKDPRFKDIRVECPVWSHVRKANPREVDGVPKKLIFRRGYLYNEGGTNRKFSSGLLFICFQRDIAEGFEYIKKKWLNNKNFPIPEARQNFTKEELASRQNRGRFTLRQLERFGVSQKQTLGMDPVKFREAVDEAKKEDAQNTGREGLCGPSELGIKPKGDYLATVSLGGGYYFVPPIYKKRISEMGEQFFNR